MLSFKSIFITSIYFLFTGSIIAQTKIDSLKSELNQKITKEERLTVLNSLTKELVKRSDKNSITYLKDYVDLARELKEYDLMADKSRFIIQHYTNKGNLDSAKYNIDKMLQYKKNFTKKSSEAHLLLKRGSYYYNNEDLNKAVSDYNIAGDLFLIERDSIFVADARFFAGQVYADANKFLKSVERFEEAYMLYDLLGDKVYANYVLNELSTIYGKNEFHKKAIKERKKILNEAKKMNSFSSMSYAYGHLATSYFKEGNYEFSKKYTDSMIWSSSKVKDEQLKKGIRIHILKLKIKYNLEKNNLQEVKQLLEKAKEQIVLTSSPGYHENSFLLYTAKFYNKKKQYNKALIPLKKLLLKKENIGDYNLIIKAEQEIASVYGKQQNYKKAHEHLANFTSLKLSKNSEIEKNTLLYYQSKFETERKDNELYKKKTEIELLEKDKEIATGKRNVLWIVILSIILLSVIISYYIWKQGKQKREVLTLKIEKNKIELEEFTKKLLNKSKDQELLTKEIEVLKKEIGEQKSLDNLESLTSTKILTNEDWYTFKQKFASVYPNFFIQLKKKGYDLTKSEERLIAMEKLYLDTNEIASMLAISNDSVTRSRSRLRRKINAPKGSSILKYLEVS